MWKMVGRNLNVVIIINQMEIKYWSNNEKMKREYFIFTVTGNTKNAGLLSFDLIYNSLGEN